MTSLTWSSISTTAWVVYTSLQATSAFRVRERIVTLVTAKRRRRQNVCVWTETEGTRQGYHLRVLLWSSIGITVSWSFTKKNMFTGKWSLEETFFKQTSHTGHTRFYCLLSSAVLLRKFTNGWEEGVMLTTI